MAHLDDIISQLTRYGGAPDQRIIDLLYLVAEMNDDMKHMRLLGSYRGRIAKLVAEFEYDEKMCSGHVACVSDPMICARCGIHINSLRPDDE